LFKTINDDEKLYIKLDDIKAKYINALDYLRYDQENVIEVVITRTDGNHHITYNIAPADINNKEENTEESSEEDLAKDVKKEWVELETWMGKVKEEGKYIVIWNETTKKQDAPNFKERYRLEEGDKAISRRRSDCISLKY
jgi:hypothetical protein